MHHMLHMETWDFIEESIDSFQNKNVVALIVASSVFIDVVLVCHMNIGNVQFLAYVAILLCAMVIEGVFVLPIAFSKWVADLGQCPADRWQEVARWQELAEKFRIMLDFRLEEVRLPSIRACFAPWSPWSPWSHKSFSLSVSSP